MPYAIENSFVYQLEEFNGQQLVIYAYGQNGEVSCASSVNDLVITDTDEAIGFQRQESLFVYPNPFRDNCTIRIMSNENSRGVIRIYNTSGAVIKSWPVELIREGINTFDFSSDGMSPGNYIVTFYGEGTLLTGKVMLMQ